MSAATHSVVGTATGASDSSSPARDGHTLLIHLTVGIGMAAAEMLEQVGMLTGVDRCGCLSPHHFYNLRRAIATVNATLAAFDEATGNGATRMSNVAFDRLRDVHRESRAGLS